MNIARKRFQRKLPSKSFVQHGLRKSKSLLSDATCLPLNTAITTAMKREKLQGHKRSSSDHTSSSSLTRTLKRVLDEAFCGMEEGDDFTAPVRTIDSPSFLSPAKRARIDVGVQKESFSTPPPGPPSAQKKAYLVFPSPSRLPSNLLMPTLDDDDHDESFSRDGYNDEEPLLHLQRRVCHHRSPSGRSFHESEDEGDRLVGADNDPYNNEEDEDGTCSEVDWEVAAITSIHTSESDTSLHQYSFLPLRGPSNSYTAETKSQAVSPEN